LDKRYNAGLYLRLSVEDGANASKRGKINPFQNESASIENQRALLSEYAEVRGWNVSRVYSDDGFSGGNYDRPAFREMLGDAKARLIDLILVKDLSRLGRDYIETGRYAEEVFPALGVRFIALMDNIDSEGNADLLPFRSILNDYHLRDLSRKVKSVLKAKAEKGEYVGRAPYGFVKDPGRKNRLLTDEYAAGVVRRIFDMRARGLGFGKIAAALNDEGTLSPGTYRYRRAGSGCPAKAWTSCVVRDILGNEAYIGHSVRFKTGYLSYKSRQVINKPGDEWIRCENAFPRIVSVEIWDAVRLLDDRRAGRTADATVEPSLFSKLLRCADCGGPMVHRKSRYTSRVTGEDHTGHAYICSNHHRTGGAVCSRHTIPENALLTIVRDDIRNRLESVEIDEGRIVRDIRERLGGTTADEAKKQRERLAARLDELASAGKKLYEDRLKGGIDVETFKSLYEKARNEREIVKAEHNRLSGLLDAAARRLLERDQAILKLREFLPLENPSNETLSELVDHIVVSASEGRSRHRAHDVRIVYRFEAYGVGVCAPTDF
jgi:DNA invertase Pin-like site-specific DNA recombinase